MPVPTFLKDVKKIHPVQGIRFLLSITLFIKQNKQCYIDLAKHHNVSLKL